MAWKIRVRRRNLRKLVGVKLAGVKAQRSKKNGVVRSFFDVGNVLQKLEGFVVKANCSAVLAFFHAFILHHKKLHISYFCDFGIAKGIFVYNNHNPPHARVFSPTQRLKERFLFRGVRLFHGGRKRC